MSTILQIETLAEPLAFLVGVLGLVWHQNRGVNQLRDEIQQTREEARQDNRDLRDEIQQTREKARQDNRDLRDEIQQTREEAQQANQYLSSAVTENGQRLSRIEGFLGIGIPGAAIYNSAGATKAAELRNPASTTQTTHQHDNTPL